VLGLLIASLLVAVVVVVALEAAVQREVIYTQLIFTYHNKLCRFGLALVVLEPLTHQALAPQV
jgi:hypothetical protein